MSLLRPVLEALLFASDKPLSASDLARLLRSAVDAAPEQPDAAALARAKEPEITAAIEELQADYAAAPRGFHLVANASGWKLATTPDTALWVRQLFPENRPARLSPSALETLAIVAYRQPITRADVEAVRGVSVDGVVQTLLDRGLIRIAGRADAPGRPLLYETTQFFLEHFGLRTIEELPNCAELRRMDLPKATPAAPAEQPDLPAAETPDTPADPERPETAPPLLGTEPPAGEPAATAPLAEDKV